MKKPQRSLNDFLSKKITDKKATQIKGGHADIRRPGNTTTTGIWDDLEIRRVESSSFRRNRF